MDKFYLVKSSPNWAYEIDFEGFDLLSEDEYQNALERFEKKAAEHKMCDCYFGSNENGIVFASEVLTDLKRAKSIDMDQHSFLLEHFNKHFGVTLYNLFDEKRERTDEEAWETYMFK